MPKPLLLGEGTAGGRFEGVPVCGRVVVDIAACPSIARTVETMEGA